LVAQRLSINGPFPRTVRTAEHWMCVAASKESTVRRKRQEILSHAGRATRCHDPRTDQTAGGFGAGLWGCTSGHERDNQNG